jgi:hypothetical protein
MLAVLKVNEVNKQGARKRQDLLMQKEGGGKEQQQ